MRLYLDNFCIYDKPFKVKFTPFKTCLLNADSGKGKSTLFEAIRFCLYGNNSNFYPSTIDPKNKKNIKTSVRIIFEEYDGLEICRIKPPDRLSVTVNNKQLTEEAAQDYINQLFGSAQMFYATSYLSQGQRHQLISLSNKEKFELLSILTFGLDPESHPDNLMKKIDSSLSKTEKEISEMILSISYQQQVLKDLKETEYDPNLNQQMISDTNQEISDLEQDLERIIKQENEIIILNNELKNLSCISFEEKDQRIYELIKDLNLDHLPRFLELKSFFKDKRQQFLDDQDLFEEYDENVPKLKIVTNVLNNWDKYQFYLKEIADNQFEETPLLDEQLEYHELVRKLPFLPVFYVEEDHPMLKYKKIINFLEDLELLESEAGQLDLGTLEGGLCYYKLTEKYPFIENFIGKKQTLDTIKDKIKRAERISQEQELAKKFKITYSQDEVEKTILGLSQLIQNQESFKQFERLEAEIDEYTTDIQTCEKSVSKLFDSIDIKIYSLEELSKMRGVKFNCPHCQQDLILKDDQLLKTDIDPISNSQFEKYSKLITKYNTEKDKLEVLKHKLEFTVEQKAKYIPGKVLDKKELTKMTLVLKELENFKFEKVKRDLEYYQQYLKYLELAEHNDFQRPQYSKKQLDKAFNFKKSFHRVGITSDTEINFICQNLGQIIKIINTYQIQKEYISIFERFKVISTQSFETLKQIQETEKVKSDNLKMYSKMITKMDPEKVFETYSLEKWQEFQRYHGYLAIKEKWQEFQSLQDFDIDLKEYEIYELKQIKKQYPQYLINQQRIKEIENILNQTKVLDSKQLTLQIQHLKLKVQHLEEVLKYSKVFGLIKSLSSNLLELETKKNGLEKIKLIAWQARNGALYSFVEYFNTQVNKVLAELFEEPIEISLLLEKQNKSNNKIKICVNFLIHYRGCVFDSPSNLSGGERDRLSLALMIGLAVSAGTKVVLLDECLASLNEELRLKCIQVIAKYLPGKTVVNICHSVTQGFHDQTIDL